MRVPSDPRRLLVALIALRGGLLTQEDAWQHLWGDRADGGPEYAVASLAVVMVQVRDAAAALGYRVDNVYGLGWRAERARSQPTAAGATVVEQPKAAGRARKTATEPLQASA